MFSAEGDRQILPKHTNSKRYAIGIASSENLSNFRLLSPNVGTLIAAKSIFIELGGGLVAFGVGVVV